MGTEPNRPNSGEAKNAIQKKIFSYDFKLTFPMIQLTRDKMLNVLLFIDGGWMVDELEGTDPTRAEQLDALRRHCIPATTFLLG